MLKKLLGRKKDKFPVGPVPRPLDEIQKEYSQLAFDAGQAQYQVVVFTKAVQTLAERMKAVNLEAEGRIKLNNEAKAQADKAAALVAAAQAPSQAGA